MTGAAPDPEIAPALLGYLRARLAGDASLAYAQAPVAVRGGYDTRIFFFRLSGAPEPWSGPLVLRVLDAGQDPRRALRERATQNAVAALGYPVPRVLAACGETGPLGAGFLVMERAAGRPLLEGRWLGMGPLLADAHVRLHALDPEPLLAALDREGRATGGAFDRSAVSYAVQLAALGRRVREAALDGLAPATQWLLDHRPGPEGPRVICHGDFHPQNLLVSEGRLAAVLDWPNLAVAEPEYDVAATRVILTLVPVALLGVPAAVRPVVAALRSLLVTRYLVRYRHARRLDPARLTYYEAAGCLRGLVRAALARRADDSNPLDTSAFGDRLARRFTRLSGVAVSLPPRRD